MNWLLKYLLRKAIERGLLPTVLRYVYRVHTKTFTGYNKATDIAEFFRTAIRSVDLETLEKDTALITDIIDVEVIDYRAVRDL